MRKASPISRSRSALAADRRPLVTAALATLLYSALGGCTFDTAGIAPAGGVDAGDTGNIDASGPGIDASGPGIDAAVPDDGPVADTAFRKPITISAAQITEDLADFPVLVTLDDAALQQRASASGRDIHFVASDGADLSHEIEVWDNTTGHITAWVRLPLISATSDTLFYIVYGDATASFPQRDPDVWRNDFVAVWHLQENPAPAMTDGILDSTESAHGTATAGMNNAQVGGPIERAIRFQANGDTINFDNPLSGNTSHTISVWVDQKATSDNDALITLGSGDCRQARWLYGRYAMSNNVAAGFYCYDFNNSGTYIQNAGWTLLHWTYDAGTRMNRIYRDGSVLAATYTLSQNANTQGNTGMLGSAPEPSFGQNMGLDGALDEARIATVVRSTAWIAAEFVNQSDPAQFYTVGPEEPAP